MPLWTITCPPSSWLARGGVMERKARKVWGRRRTPNTYQPSPLPYWQFTCPPVQQCCADHRHFQKAQRSFYTRLCTPYQHCSATHNVLHAVRGSLCHGLPAILVCGARARLTHLFCTDRVGTGGRLAESGRKAPRFLHRRLPGSGMRPAGNSDLRKLPKAEEYPEAVAACE